jgi:hypothetical protein
MVRRRPIPKKKEQAVGWFTPAWIKSAGQKWQRFVPAVTEVYPVEVDGRYPRSAAYLQYGNVIAGVAGMSACDQFRKEALSALPFVLRLEVDLDYRDLARALMGAQAAAASFGLRATSVEEQSSLTVVCCVKAMFGQAKLPDSVETEVEQGVKRLWAVGEEMQREIMELAATR